jgi:hypothetical protein
MALSTNKMGGLISTHLNKGGKMKYLILQDTVANKEKVKAGDIVLEILLLFLMLQQGME